MKLKTLETLSFLIHHLIFGIFIYIIPLWIISLTGIKGLTIHLTTIILGLIDLLLIQINKRIYKRINKLKSE